MSTVNEIKCSHCGAPIEFKPGEILATCKYCGFTVVIETGQPYDFEHSMILNRFDPAQVEEPIRDWMRGGFIKPADLARKAKLTQKDLVYLPFWIISAHTQSMYKGVIERITPSITKEGKIDKQYNWLVIGRKATNFPTEDYDIPLQGKIPYDFRKIEDFAKVLNSEIDQDSAVDIAKQQIEENHRFLASQDIDRVVEWKTEVTVDQVVYLHAPIWFVAYEYKSKNYQLLLDGATGATIRGDIPSSNFGII